MPQIALIAHKHNDNVHISVVTEFLQPSVDVLVGSVLGNVVDEEGSDRAAVVSDGREIC